MVWHFAGRSKPDKTTDQSAALQRRQVNKFLDNMRNLSSFQLLAVAQELADPSYDLASAIMSPPKESRVSDIHSMMSLALGAGAGRQNSKRSQLRATHSLQVYLQDAEHPEKRYSLLHAVMIHLFPKSHSETSYEPGFYQLSRDLRLPAGLTQDHICDLCQRQHCYMHLSEWYPAWLQPKPEQIIGTPTADNLVLLANDHPLAILFHFAMHLQTDPGRSEHPILWKEWIARANSLPDDHPVWQFDRSDGCWENGSTADIHAYVPVYAPAPGASLFVGWVVSPKEAQVYISRLAYFSKIQWAPSQPSQSNIPLPLLQVADETQAHEKSGQPSPSADQQGRLEGETPLADGTVAADPDLLSTQPAEYMRRLFMQCGLRDGGLRKRQAMAQANGEDAAAPAQDPDGASGQTTMSAGQSRADAVAQALLLEEETAKARAQAHKDAQKAKRGSKSGKASSKGKPGKDPARGAQEIMASHLPGKAETAKLDPADVASSAIAGQQQQQLVPFNPSQEASSAVSGVDRLAAPSSSKSSGQDESQVSSLAFNPRRVSAAEDLSASGLNSAQQQPQARLSMLASNDSVSDVPAACNLDSQLLQVYQPHALQQGNETTRTASSAPAPASCFQERPGLDLHSAAGASSPVPAVPSMREAPLQMEHIQGHAAELLVTRISASTKASRSRLLDPNRREGATADGAPSPKHHAVNAPEPAQMETGTSQDADGSMAAGSRRCQPRIRSKSHEAPSQVSPAQLRLARPLDG